MMVSPQPFDWLPHIAPTSLHEKGSQGGGGGGDTSSQKPPLPHAWPLGQKPQSSVPPQWSEMDPHSAPKAAQVVGVQPQWLGTLPPPQVSGDVHSPQSTTPPHPSGTCPHSAGTVAHVSG